MHKLLLAGPAALLALAAPLAPANAAPITFGYTGAIQTYTVQTTGTYDILAIGAGGANGFYMHTDGGLGAKIEDTFDLTAGEVLDVLVGGKGAKGSDGPGGGGGGSFVVAPGNAPLLIASGGGGGGDIYGPGGNGAGLGGNGTGGAGGASSSGGGGGGGGGGLTGDGTAGKTGNIA